MIDDTVLDYGTYAHALFRATRRFAHCMQQRINFSLIIKKMRRHANYFAVARENKV